MRHLTSQHLSARQSAEAFRGLLPGISRFKVIHDLRTVGSRLGFSRNLIGHLELLVSFTRETDWKAGGTPMCWLSVSQLANRLGISRQQVSRNERKLIELGAIAHSDYGNYRRFGHRDKDGEIARAFGVDLRPLAAIAPGIHRAVLAWEEERELWNGYKLAISALRRRLRDLAGSEPAGRLDSELLDKLHQEKVLNGRIKSGESLAALKRIRRRLEAWIARLTRAIRRLVDNSRQDKEMSANMFHKCHQNVPPVEHGCVTPYKNNKENERKTVAVVEATTAAPPTPPEHKDSGPMDGREEKGSQPSRVQRGVTPAKLVEIAPDMMRWRLPEGRSPNWREIVDVAHFSLPALGISQSAWAEACSALGRSAAAAAVVIIARKFVDGKIAIPGGYLRSMVARKASGQLDLSASLHGLLLSRRPGLPPLRPGSPEAEAAEEIRSILSGLES